jgi:hypothetical protein
MDSVVVLDGLAQRFVYLDRSAHILVLITVSFFLWVELRMGADYMIQVNACHKELTMEMLLDVGCGGQVGG